MGDLSYIYLTLGLSILIPFLCLSYNVYQWGVFKRSAAKIQTYLSENGCEASVEINAEKPGRGNFVVRVEGVDEPILELLSMKRPFKALRETDMDDIGKLVVEALE